MKKNKLFIKKILLFAITVGCNIDLYAQDGVTSIPNITDEKVISVQIPTEIGVAGEIFYSFYGAENTWYIGPGVFIDYKINNFLTLSANTFINFQSFVGGGNSQLVKPGIFIKHWLSSEWGYVGIGLEGLFYSGINGEYFQLMVAAIVTGENVGIKTNINTIGDLKLAISLFNTGASKDIRFNIAYTLGLAFELKGLNKTGTEINQ